MPTSTEYDRPFSPHHRHIPINGANLMSIILKEPFSFVEKDGNVAPPRVMSVACHDPDFVLAEGTHQVADTLCIGSDDLSILRVS